MKIIPQNDQLVTRWTGGTTRQLYIYPENSVYAERNFELRISTATIEVETSVFTSLPGYSRQLMVLEGELLLEHEDQHGALLKKFDTNGFLGVWKTTSKGKATDFNVMSVEGYNITLQAYQSDVLSETINETPSVEKFGIYLYKGHFTLINNDHEYSCNEGDFILLEGVECHNGVKVESQTPVELVAVLVESH